MYLVYRNKFSAFQSLTCYWCTRNLTGGCSGRIWLEVGSRRCFPSSQEGHVTVRHAGMRNPDIHHDVLHSRWVISLHRGHLIWLTFTSQTCQCVCVDFAITVIDFGELDWSMCTITLQVCWCQLGVMCIRHLLILVFIFSVVFACLGFLSPANRGALMTCALVSLYIVLYWLSSNSRWWSVLIEIAYTWLLFYLYFH